MQTTELLDDIKQVLDISSRVDERVKIIQAGQQELNVRLNHFIDELNLLSGRVMVLESKNGNLLHSLQEEVTKLASKLERMNIGGTEASRNETETVKDIEKKFLEFEKRFHVNEKKIQDLEKSDEGWQNKLRQYGLLIVQGIWAIIMSYLLYKLGLKQ